MELAIQRSTYSIQFRIIGLCRWLGSYWMQSFLLERLFSSWCCIILNDSKSRWSNVKFSVNCETISWFSMISTRSRSQIWIQMESWEESNHFYLTTLKLTTEVKFLTTTRCNTHFDLDILDDAEPSHVSSSSFQYFFWLKNIEYTVV